MKKALSIILLLFITLTSFPQLKPLSDQYILNPMTLNPAYAGNRGALSIAAFYRQQWVGIEGAPRILTLSADAPILGDKIGVGLTIVNDRIGVLSETTFSTIYSYKVNMGESKLSFGLGAGVMTTNTKWSELTAIDPGDDNYLIDSKVFAVPDFSFGIYYSVKNYFAGISVPRLLTYKFDYDLNKYDMSFAPEDYFYLFNTGYVFNLSERTRLFPSTLVYFSPGEKILYDINANVSLMDKFWLGASYRSERSIAAFFQFHVNEQFNIAYMYNFQLGKLSRYSTGTHEIMMRYTFKYRAEVANPLVF
jgi:type IX secretion system PorP/SprF family membrane protein